MSRIGRKKIDVPAGVKIAVQNVGAKQEVSVQGPLGTQKLSVAEHVKVTWAESEKAIHVTIDPAFENDRQTRANWGTVRALIQNNIVGVTKGYEKSLEVVGVGWTAAVTGAKLKLSVGFANPILVDIPTGLKVAVDKQFIKINGSDKQMVGYFASSVRAKRKPEPYNGKGVKYTTEVIKKKQGKQFGA